MRNAKWLIALVALMAMGLIAAGCGDDDDTTAASDTATEATDTSAEETTSDDSGDTSGSSSEDVLNACIDVIEGKPSEDSV